MNLSTRRARSAARLALVSTFILAPACLAQTATGPDAATMFPFVLPWDDATPGTVTDLSYLNAKPAGVNGRIIAKDGHFVEAQTGRRVRFLGINFTFESNFPTHEDATKIAAHLAKMGFNIVRIHHHDMNGSSLWDKAAPGHQKLDATAMDRLDFLIAELKKNGIYTNLNLHVSRSFVPADGFPESVNQLPERYAKRVDRFDARMIELQKQFARDYLTHVNPYTKLSYTEDPCIAVVEINNENSLMGWGTFDSYFDKLPEPFLSDIRLKWNDWLAKRYGTEPALRTAWTAGQTEAAPGTEPKLADSQWQFESRVANATLTPSDVAGQTFADVEITNTETAPQPWDLQPQIRPLNFEDGKIYAVSFRARADKVRTIRLQSGVMGGDWHNVGLASPVRIGTDWMEFRYAFRATKPEPNNNRISFVMGNDTGTVKLSNVRIEPATASELVPSHYAFKLKNIDLPSGTIAPQTADWFHFLTDTERQYSDEMRRYLRQDLAVKANLVDSQMSFGASSSFNREAGSDFIDEHSYWEHPTFPSTTWDPANWTINQISMVKALAANVPNALTPLALNRVAGKPYSVSEYCVPSPNDFEAEMFPIVASYAALQDWDAVYHFDYGDYGANKNVNRIQGFFALAGNPIKESFVTASALLFRTGKMAPLQNVSTLQLTAEAPFAARRIRDVWAAANGKTPVNLLESRLQVAVDSRVPETQLSKQPATTATSAARIVPGPAGPQYVAEGQGAVAIAGFVGGQKVQTKTAEFTFPTFGNNYAALMLTTVQDPALNNAGRLLLTIGGRTQNSEMGWNAARTSVGNNWGKGPAQAEGIPATIALANPRLKHVWALDPTGARMKEIPATAVDGKLTFTIGPEYRTLQYEIGE